MSDTAPEATTESAPSSDPFASLDADVAEIKRNAESGQQQPRNEQGQFASEEQAPAESQPDTTNWQSEHNALKQKMDQREKELQTFFQTHFKTNEDFEAFQAWSEQRRNPSPEPEPEIESGFGLDDDDIFSDVDKIKAWQKEVQREMESVRQEREARSQQALVRETEAEATELAKKYPAVANPEGKDMMLRLLLTTMNQGGTMEDAAKMVQKLAGSPGQVTQQAGKQSPTVIPRGLPGASAKKLQEPDERERRWYTGDIDAFDAIKRDTQKEFNMRS